MTSRLHIIVTGLIAQHPWLGGVTWDYVQYPLGLQRLGHDVYYVEDSGEWPYTRDGGASGRDWVAPDCTPNVTHLAGVMERFGLGGKWAYRFPTRDRWYGLSDGARAELLRSADLLLNVSGTLDHPEAYGRGARLLYLDTDPVFTQVKMARGDGAFRRRVDAHHAHFSFGECLSDAVPSTGHRWRPTRQPIVLAEWRPAAPRRPVFTTVMSWTSYRPLQHAGRTYAQKDVEFRGFLELPGRVAPTALEVALGDTTHVDWQEEVGPGVSGAAEGATGRPRTPRAILEQHGWRVVSAGEVCGGLDAYRAYVESSRGEWSVAKNGYVLGQPGWFSCRSACYLAAGRPVVVQDTGFGAVLPVGEGILPFKTMAEAVAAVHEVEGNYPRHAKAARAIAKEYFDSDRILARLIEEACGT